MVGRHWRKLFFLEEKQMIARTLFEEYDTDGGGRLDATEIHALCNRLGKKMTMKQAEKLVDKLDDSGDMQLDADEFTRWWTHDGGKHVDIPDDIPRDMHAMGDAYYALEIGCYVEMITWTFGLLLYMGKYADEGSWTSAIFAHETFQDFGGSAVFMSASAFSLWCVSLGAKDELEAQKAEKRAVARILFREYDSDGTGWLDFNEVKALCERLGKKMDDQELRKMLRKVGGEDMEIDTEEFVSWCVGLLLCCSWVCCAFACAETSCFMVARACVCARAGGSRMAGEKFPSQKTSRISLIVQVTVWHIIEETRSARQWTFELTMKCGGSRRTPTFQPERLVTLSVSNLNH